MRLGFFHISVFLLLLLMQACSVTKGLPDDTQVVRSVVMDMEIEGGAGVDKSLKSELMEKVIFEPTVGVRKSRVHIYNNANKKNKTKGFAYWLQKKIGVRPEIFKQSILNTSTGRIKKKLLDEGHFSAEVIADTTVEQQLVDIRFKVYSAGRYKIDSVFGLKDNLLNRYTKNQNSFLDLKKSTYYNKIKLDKLRAESVELLRSQGYFNVEENQFYYYLDTVPGNKMVDIYYEFTDPEATATKRYRYRNIHLYPNHGLDGAGGEKIQNAQQGLLTIYSDSTIFKSKLFNRIINVDSTRFYSPKEDLNIMSRLRATGVFKYVNLTYDTLSTDRNYYLDRKLNLTPGLMEDLGVEFEVNSTNGNALGSEVSANYQHLNLFKGAENFKLKASLGGEFLTTASNQSGVFNTYELVLSSSLALPGLLGFGKNRFLSKGPNIPHTTFTLSNQLQTRNSFYKINSSDFAYTYTIGSANENHRLSLLSADYVKVLEKGAQLDSLLEINSGLAESLRDLFIFATSYKYYFSSPKPGKKKGGYYHGFQGGLESAGALAKLLTPRGQDSTIFGQFFSQYIKGDLEFTPKYAMGDHLLAGRISLGVGIPYGNSSVLPYTKQYFVGGASSLRAFDIRTLGPGRFVSAIDTSVSNSTRTNFIDQTGDIKLELNLEYRFPIFSYLKGAVFVDAGNIWLANDSTSNLGVFEFKEFYKELGFGGGVGFRLDLGITVLRLDIATPFYDPEESVGWVIKDWRQNLKYRIGVGYPF